MKILLLFFSLNTFASEDLVGLCVNNSVLKNKNIKKICQCTVDKTIVHINSDGYKTKDPARLKWFKDYLSRKLTHSEINEDKYSILEFEYYFAKDCIKKYTKP